MNWLLLVETVVAVYLSWCVLALVKNYLKVRNSGFQVYISPANSSNPLWLLFGASMVLLIVPRIPDFIWRRIKYTVHGWEFAEQQQRTRSPENAVMMVTAGKNELWIGDPDLALPILTRRKDFTQGEVTKFLLGIFGPGVMTTDGHDWQRHRGFVAQALNENISRIVWDESTGQASQMLDNLLQENAEATTQTVAGLRRVAFNVLAAAGYGVSNTWAEQPPTESENHKLSYSEVLSALTTGFMLIAVMPISFLRLKLWPKVVRTIAMAAQEFPIYTREMLEQERQLSMAASQQRKNFMSSMVKMSDGEKDDAKGNKDYLSEDEIQSNMFQFTLAGFDTTANTLSYALANLAIRQDLQEWIQEEIDSATSSERSLTYADIFPKLTRCLALMFETLRLYTPVANLGRATPDSHSISTPTKTYAIPAGTRLFVSLARLHTDPQYWGKDALDFRPSRWISEDHHADGRQILHNHRGMFVPWSDGARKCPGMKMAQVEFLAVIFTLFRTATVRPAQAPGETRDVAERRILAAITDSRPRITLQMNNPENINLVWRKRASSLV